MTHAPRLPGLLAAAAMACAPGAVVQTQRPSSPAMLTRREPTPIAEPHLADVVPTLDVDVDRSTLENGMRVVVSPMAADEALVGWVVRGAGYGSEALASGVAHRLAEALALRASRASEALPGGHAPLSLAWRVHPSAALFWATLRPSEVGAAVASFAAAVRGMDASHFEAIPAQPAPAAPRPPWERLRYEDGWDPRAAATGVFGGPSLPPAAWLARFRAAYTPAAVSLVVAGPVSAAEVAAYTEPLLGPWRGGVPLSAAQHAFRVTVGASTVWRVEAQRSPFVELRARLTLRVPDARAQAAARVACALLEYRNGSRLYTRLREESGTAYAFDTQCEESGGVYSVDVALTAPTERSTSCAATLRAVLASLSTEGVDGARFEALRLMLARREGGRLDTPYDRAFAMLEAEGDDVQRGALERPWLRALWGLTAAAVSGWLASAVRVEQATLFVTASARAMPDVDAMAAVFPGTMLREDEPPPSAPAASVASSAPSPIGRARRGSPSAEPSHAAASRGASP